jgi:hypothetical protein
MSLQCQLLALEVVQRSIATLIAGCGGTFPDLDMTIATIGILGAAIFVKLVLWYLCTQISHLSPSAGALAQVYTHNAISWYHGQRYPHYGCLTEINKYAYRNMY